MRGEILPGVSAWAVGDFSAILRSVPCLRWRVKQGSEMSNDSTQRLVGSAVAVSAVCFAAIGALLLFAPDEVGRTIIPHASGAPLLQLLGAALLGFGAMNWIARGSVLGGIYGRAVVAGNQTHLTIGALLLVKHGLVAGGSAAYWILTGVYVLGAGLFLYLFFSSGLRGKP